MIICSCSDDDNFSVQSDHILTFSTDTVKLDTAFSNIPTPTYSFWVYNRSGDGIRCLRVSLENGNQTGFRVNVDGTYLGESVGFQTNNVEIRNKDSIRVFVELTSPMNITQYIKKVQDNLIFTLESGVTQKVNLNAYSWDATLLKTPCILKDSTLSGSKPIVIYGGLTVNSAATLTIAAGTTLYFHNNAGLDVYGRLLTSGTADKNVVLRGDRIDHMFDNLPYDNVSGQWQGIHFHASSYGNVLTYTDVHSTYNGIVADSADVNQLKLSLISSTVHNCQGYGVMLINNKTILENCQLTNTLYDCLYVNGGICKINNCTLAQFYPFDTNRGATLRFSGTHTSLSLQCLNTLITGYADDVLMGEQGDTAIYAFDYVFDHCVIRTPKITTIDSLHFTHVIFENHKDTASTGTRHFIKIDTDNLRYDFRLSDISSAINAADSSTAMPFDRNGLKRKDSPDVGAFEWQEPSKKKSIKIYNHGTY